MATTDLCTNARWTFPLVKIDGVYQYECETLTAMKSRPIREDDIFLCTYPKSERNYLFLMQYSRDSLDLGDLPYDRGRKGRVRQTLEKHYSTGIQDRRRTGGTGITQDHSNPLNATMPELLWERRCKVVYVQRNPKDCAVSYFCQLSQQRLEGSPSQEVTFTGSWDEFLSLFMAGCVPNGSIFHHVQKWGNVSDMHTGFEICNVRYEDMKQDCVAQVRRIAEYLDRPLTEEKYQEIAEACSFENLKNACEKYKDKTYYFPWKDGSSGYFRKGEPGDWKNWFTVAQSEEFDRQYELEMTRN